MKKVLVLMSTYNGEKYINEMIDSILNQIKIEVNILIRDDGSKDNTISIIEKYKDKRIKIIKGCNKGCTNSFFDLIMSSSLEYDYYSLCDQDDFWLKDKLVQAVDKLDSFSDDKPGLYYSGQIITDQNLNITSYHKLNKKRTRRANFIFNNMAGCTCVFNRKLLEILRVYYPINVAEHDNWIYKLCASVDSNIYVDTNEYILYRQHGNNVVGLKNGFKGKIKRGIQQIKNTNPSKYANLIIVEYNDYLDEDSKKFLEELIYARRKISSRIKLCFRKDIKFNSISLRIIYILKLIIGKI